MTGPGDRNHSLAEGAITFTTGAGTSRRQHSLRSWMLFATAREAPFEV
jgi:hypothetical protein